MDSTDDYSVALLPRTSPLNTALNEITLPGSSKDTEMEESEEEIPSYQPQTKQPDGSAKQRQKDNRKRKAESDNLYSLEAKIKRTEESIEKLQKHLDNKTCPKSLRYTARANIPPDEQFKKDIQAVKLKAEQGFLSALTRFNHRRLEKQKTRLRKEKGKTVRKGTAKRGSNTSLNKLQNQPLSADISVKSLAALLGMDSEKVPTLLSTLQAAVNNKNVEKYTCLFTESFQPSVTLEHYLEEVKLQIAEIKITRPKHNLSRKERKALNALKQNKDLNFKKADKGTTLVVMNKNDKIQEGQVQINDLNNYKPLDKPIVKETHTKVSRLISELSRNNYIDDMTKKWLSQTPNPPRIPEFYTLTKIHKPTLVGRPIISGCNGPTERISAFVDTLLQPISTSQTSYLKDSTDFINFIEKTKMGKRTFLVTMDVTSLYTNIPQEEGITTVCNAYENFHKNNPPIPTNYIKEMLRLILKENSFQFNGKNYLQIHGTAMGTKMAVAFANIFMAYIETEILSKSVIKPLIWKRYIDDIFSLWDVSKQDIDKFITQANSHHPTIKFTAEISNTEATFLDTVVYKGKRFQNQSTLDVKTHFKPTETFQYTHFSSCHPPGVKKGFVKGEALRLLRTNSSKTTFEENINKFKSRLLARGYPKRLIETLLSDIKFTERESALKQKNEDPKDILPFVTQYHPGVPHLKKVLLEKWHLIQNQPSLRQIFKEPPLISFKRGKSLKDVLVRAKL
ncbi:uncharacterized protein [Montipora capricornis]|uniref:uncharacterized protein n=1 Tax=Montipora capricornis TaxID=246305 RepID=UPI0035F2105E